MFWNVVLALLIFTILGLSVWILNSKDDNFFLHSRWPCEELKQKHEFINGRCKICGKVKK